MKRITVRLGPVLDEAFKAEAVRLGVSMSQLGREMITAHLAETEAQRLTAEDAPARTLAPPE